jgi:Tol biopolymer transport system component
MRVSNRHPRHSLLLVVLLFSAIVDTAHATFPGRNGRIAFVQGPDIYTMNADGSDVKQLTNVGTNNIAYWESWSPDGNQIVFNEYLAPDFIGQLWVMNADGSNQHLLLEDTDFSDERPSFTRDAKSVVFSRCGLDIEECALFQVEIKGGAIKAITNFQLGIKDLSPHYSAEGQLAFTGVARQGIICAIELMDSDQSRESDLVRLTPARLSPRHPDWSPDGASIAFSTHCGNPQNEEIWMITVKEKKLSRLTNNGNDYYSGPHDFFPSWSPEGDWIVFERDAPDFSSSGIFVMRPDSSGCRQLIALGRSLRPSKGERQGNRNLDNRAARRLKRIEDGGVLPQWGPAGN